MRETAALDRGLIIPRSRRNSQSAPSSRYYLLRVEESFPTLHVALPAAAAVGLRLRSEVVPAVWSRWHVSRTTSDAQGSITRAARAMPWQHAFSAGRRSHDSAELWTSEADLAMAHGVWVRVIFYYMFNDGVPQDVSYLLLVAIACAPVWLFIVLVVGPLLKKCATTKTEGTLRSTTAYGGILYRGRRQGLLCLLSSSLPLPLDIRRPSYTMRL